MSYFFISLSATEADAEACRSRGQRDLSETGLPCTRTLEVPGALFLAGAPQDQVLECADVPEGSGFLLGIALAEDGRRISLAALAARWEADPQFQPDGCFVAALRMRDGRLHVAADPLGVLPVFYHQLPDGTWLVAGAPRDLRAHPAMRFVPCPLGIAGQLLLNSSLGRHTVVEGVHLLQPREQLHLRPGQTAVPSAAPLPEAQVPARFEDALEQFAVLWPRSLRQTAAITAGQPVDLMLSGGRDSRQLLADLRQVQTRIRLFTFGLPGENEVRAAKAVARHFCSHRLLRVDDRDPSIILKSWAQRAGRMAVHGGGTCGATAPHPRMRPWIYHGILHDDLFGGYAAQFAKDPDTGELTAESFYSKLNRWGFPPETLAALFRDPAHQPLGAELLAARMQAFRTHPGGPAQASFDEKLATRGRCHLGSAILSLSRHTWPLTPAFSQELIAFLRALPLEFIADRRLQNAWMAREHPALLKIPFDNNTGNFSADLSSRFWPAWRRSPRLAQPLRYHRMLSMNHPAWQQIYRETLPKRERLHGLMDANQLRKLWPDDPASLKVKNPFAELAGLRSLMALAHFFTEVSS